MPTPASVAAGERLTVALGEARPDDRSLGGKGASLDRLARLGRPIPPGFCVTAASYRAWLASVADRGALGAAVTRLPDPAARDEIVAQLSAAATPDPVRDAVATALRALTRELTQREPILAVRSSALDEDGAAASFAGVHETELGLPPDVDEVLGAVRRCWLSLWSQAAVAYRARRGLPFDGVAMAVVVQAVVPAEISVVVFTRHPVTGRDDVLINAIRGLGEPMVSGTATPETVVVDRAGRILERIPGDRGPRLFVRGGAVGSEVDLDAAPILDDGAAVALAETALDVERQFGGPVDIEAAFAGGRWILLQARPITAGLR